jgi:hypothetical protein
VNRRLPRNRRFAHSLVTLAGLLVLASSALAGGRCLTDEGFWRRVAPPGRARPMKHTHDRGCLPLSRHPQMAAFSCSDSECRTARTPAIGGRKPLRDLLNGGFRWDVVNTRFWPTCAGMVDSNHTVSATRVIHHGPHK